MGRQVFIMKTLSVRVHLNVSHQLPNVRVSIGRRVAVGLNVRHGRQAFSQLVFVGQREQVRSCRERADALQVLCGEGQMRVTAEGGRVVEQRDERLVKELVVIFGRLLVEQSPVMIGASGQRKTFSAEICTCLKRTGKCDQSLKHLKYMNTKPNEAVHSP